MTVLDRAEKEIKEERGRKCLRKKNNSWESYKTYVEEQDKPD